jgi:outer membrane protein assembly factor BamB
LIRSSLSVLALVSLTTTLFADDWPEFRGPTGQGLVLAGDLPVEWSTTKNVAWKQAIPGKGWSSPIVVKGRIYLTTAVPTGTSQSADQSLRALCLDATSGKTLWNQEVFKQNGATAPRIHAKNSHASPTPLCDGERLYVHFGHQGTACLDLAGKILWRNTSLKYSPVHGNGGSPIVAGDKLVFSVDGSDRQFVVALHKLTGKEVWKTDRRCDAVKKFAFSTPLMITVNGRQQIVSPGSDAVCAYDPQAGREVWRVQYEGYSIIPRPVFAHDLVIFSTGYDTPQLLAVRPDGQGDVTDTHIAWRLKNGAPHSSSPLVVGDELYVVSDAGVATCLDARTGKVHWRQRLDGNFSASPLHANGKIYFQDEEGMGTVIKAGKQFEQLAKNELEERTLASYAAADGALFIRTEKHLYRIEQK